MSSFAPTGLPAISWQELNENPWISTTYKRLFKDYEQGGYVPIQHCLQYRPEDAIVLLYWLYPDHVARALLYVMESWMKQIAGVSESYLDQFQYRRINHSFALYREYDPNPPWSLQYASLPGNFPLFQLVHTFLVGKTHRVESLRAILQWLEKSCSIVGKSPTVEQVITFIEQALQLCHAWNLGNPIYTADNLSIVILKDFRKEEVIFATVQNGRLMVQGQKEEWIDGWCWMEVPSLRKTYSLEFPRIEWAPPPTI